MKTKILLPLIFALFAACCLAQDEVKHRDATRIEYGGKVYIEDVAPVAAPAVEIASLTQIKIAGESAGDLATALRRYPAKANAILDALEQRELAAAAQITALKAQLQEQATAHEQALADLRTQLEAKAVTIAEYQSARELEKAFSK